MIIIKSQDTKVKNFGFIVFDKSGVKNIAFLPIEKFEEFTKDNNSAEIKVVKIGETKISVCVPFGLFKDEPIEFEIRGNKNKFITAI